MVAAASLESMVPANSADSHNAWAEEPQRAATGDSQVGLVIGERYRLLERIGQGGMATVYLAEHVALEKRFAVKILRDEFVHSVEVVERFIQEGRAASKIGHDFIVDVTDCGNTPSGSYFLAMEYLDGCDLAKELRLRGPMPAPRVRHIGAQICEALQAAHDVGITHRDIKPANVFLIDRPDRRDLVKILDFGVAKVNYLDHTHATLTQAKVVLGTPEYMAPEQISGEDVVDHRADVYSVGCVLFELLTGTPPFQGDNVMKLLTGHLFHPAPTPSQRAPQLNIPSDVDQVVLRALEKRPDQRFQSMRELGEALAATTDVSSISQHLAEAALAVEAGHTVVALDRAERVWQEVHGDTSLLAAHQPLLERIYRLGLGDLRRTVTVGSSARDVDSRTAFVLSRLEQPLSIEDLLDVSGMPRLSALRLLHTLLRDGLLTEELRR